MTELVNILEKPSTRRALIGMYDGKKRFNNLMKATGLSGATLSRRLKDLLELELVEMVYKKNVEGRNYIVLYRLTSKGKKLVEKLDLVGYQRRLEEVAQPPSSI